MPAQQGNNLSISQIRDGLINPNFTTHLYVSETSFTVAGDVTSWLRPGRGLVITFQTSGIKRGTVVSLSYDSGTNKTTINTVGDNLVNETITSVLLSLSDGENIISAGLSKARATRGTEQAIPNAIRTKVIYDTEVYDGLGEYDPTNARFTAKNNGWYHVSVSILFKDANWPANKVASFFIYKNGSLYSVLARFVIFAAISNAIHLLGSDDVYLNKNDYIEIYAIQDSGATKYIRNSAIENYFSIHRFA